MLFEILGTSKIRFTGYGTSVVVIDMRLTRPSFERITLEVMDYILYYTKLRGINIQNNIVVIWVHTENQSSFGSNE